MMSLRFGLLYGAVIILVSCGDNVPTPVTEATIKASPSGPTVVQKAVLVATTPTPTSTFVSVAPSGPAVPIVIEVISNCQPNCGSSDRNIHSHTYPGTYANRCSNGNPDTNHCFDRNAHIGIHEHRCSNGNPDTNHRSHCNAYTRTHANRRSNGNTYARTHANA